jgi:transcriptional regulator with XRE-family HTH domain
MLGKTLRTLRRMQDVSLEELAAVTDISVGFLKNVEAEACTPTLDQSRLIAEFFDMSPGDFIAGALPTHYLCSYERELLSVLAEEAAEVVQAAMKISRHGYGQRIFPAYPYDNLGDLETEMGQLRAVMRLTYLIRVDESKVAAAEKAKYAEMLPHVHSPRLKRAINTMLTAAEMAGEALADARVRAERQEAHRRSIATDDPLPGQWHDVKGLGA